MKLLEASLSGKLADDLTVPTEAQALLLNASLMIVSATVSAPVMLKAIPCNYSEYLGFHVTEVINAEGSKVKETISVKNTGELEGRFAWLARMFWGFNLLKQAIDVTESHGHGSTAHKLKNILLRSNLLLGLVEAIRFEQDAQTLSNFIETRLDNCLEIYCDFGILPPDLLAHTMSRSLKARNQIPDTLEAWEQVAEIAYEVWDQAEERAVKARKSERFAEMFAIAQSSLPYYWASVDLFWDAMARHNTLMNGASDDLLRDFGVVEEHRVGVVELLSHFGHHLISRPCHFFAVNKGSTIKDAVRKALLGARAEISIYSERLIPCWDTAVTHVSETQPTLEREEEWWFVSMHLRKYMEQNFSSAFTDPDVASAALHLYEVVWGSSSLDLQPDWYRNLFEPSKSLLMDQPIQFGSGRYTYKQIREEQLLGLLFAEE